MLSQMMKQMRANPNIIMAQIARSYAAMEVRESGRNRGRWVDAITHMGGGDCRDAGAWCAYFAWACAHQAGLATGHKLVSKTSGGVVRSWLKNPDAQITPADIKSGRETLQPGDIMVRVRRPEDLEKVYQGSTALGHAEVVIRATDAQGFIHTVGGNTNGEDSAEGDGVYEKIHGIHIDDARLIGFIRPQWQKL